MDYRIFPPSWIDDLTIDLPQSKSIYNRALIINALGHFDINLLPEPQCDDSRLLRHAILAIATGSETSVNIGGAGTAMRFLTAMCAATEGISVTLDGDERMRQRPIAPLVEALITLGADISYLNNPGYPPIAINGRTLTGGQLSIDASISSQFISALLMAAPYMQQGLDLTLQTDSDIVSLPYIDMTLTMMHAAGATAEREANILHVAPKPYSQPYTSVEPDWSAASYWYEIAALTAFPLSISHLSDSKLQGDSQVADIFSQLGIDTTVLPDNSGIELQPQPDTIPRLRLDLTDCPDLTPAVAVTAAMLRVPFTITGLRSLRIKECDRIQAIATELERLGIICNTSESTISWEGTIHPVKQMPEFHTYSDHRMAMALAPISIMVPGIVILNPEVVNKSYPLFWDHLRAAGFILVDPSLTPEQVQEIIENQSTSDDSDFTMS